MKPLYAISIACVLGFTTPAAAQDIPDNVAAVLEAQGFVITSKRYTWLGRIFVEATNGEYDRSILMTRGSGSVLQDDWAPVTHDVPTSNTSSQAKRETGNAAASKPASPPKPPRRPPPPSSKGGDRKGPKPSPGGRP